MEYPGQTIFKPLNIYTGWFPREGDNLILQFEVIAVNDAGKLDVQILTKSSDSSNTTGTSVVTIASPASTVGRHDLKADTAALQDLVRIRWECEGTGTTPWVHFRVINLIWYDTPNAATT